MVAGLTYYWRADEQTCARHEAVIRGLLAAEADGSAFFGRVVAQEPDTDAALLRRRLTASRDEEQVDWTAAPETLFNDLAGECARRRREGDDVRVEALRHRVFLTRRGLDKALTAQSIGSWIPPADDGDEFSVVLDFRFDQIVGQAVCHVAVSIWSGEPWSGNHRPRVVDEPPLIVTRPLRVDQCADRFHDEVVPAVGGYLEACGLQPFLPPVFERPYRPPVFWLAVPVSGDLRTDALAYFDDLYRPDRRTVATTVLAVDDDRDCVVSAAQLNGQVLVLRRLVPTRSGETVPTYLMLPARAQPDRPGDEAAMRKAVEAQEDTVRHIVTTLTMLETTAAAVMFDREKDLAIWENHLEVYQRVAESGSRLWDGLATHLLYQSGRQLDRAHRLVQLIHQTMLQGMADVEVLAAEVAGCLARLDETRDDLIERFDDQLTETHAGERDGVRREGVRRALTSTGPVERLQRRATDVQEVAVRVQASYRNLLTSVSSAFDERRVREGERLQKAGAVLAVIVALVGVVTVLDAGLNGWKFEILQPNGSEFYWYRFAARVFSGMVAVFLLVFPTWMIGRYVLRPRPLGTADYRRLYRQVWNLLRHTTTDRLDQFRAQRDQRDRPIGPHYTTPEELRQIELQREAAALTAWRDLDDGLAKLFGEVWDGVAALDAVPRVAPAPPAAGDGRAGAVDGRKTRDDITRLEALIEKWSLQTLLLTERPRRLHRYCLPRLTAMYHACGVLDGTVLDPSGATAGMLTAVDEWDFRLALQRRELDRDREWCDVFRWLLTQPIDGMSRGDSAYVRSKNVRVPNVVAPP